MKTITIAGNVTKDAVLRRTQSGEPVLGFSVAVNDNRTKQAIFFEISLWGKRGDALAQYLTKGTKVAVSGDLGQREHDGKTYLTVNVQDVTLMGSPHQPSERDSYGNKPARQTKASFSHELDDEVPFNCEWR
jgi:single-strand DNA-binding protein